MVCVQSRQLPFLSRIAHAAPASRESPCRVFGPPNFPKAVGKKLFLKIGSPEKVASDPIPGRSWRPAVRTNHARKAVVAPFRTAAPGVLFEASRVNAVLDAAAGLRTQP
jgi:hypothetical protein